MQFPPYRAESRAPRVRTLLMLLALVATVAPAAQAAKVYRCGNVFQDQPCPEVRAVEARSLEPPKARDASGCDAAASAPTRPARAGCPAIKSSPDRSAPDDGAVARIANVK